MNKKTTFYIFMLTLISINCFTCSSGFSQTITSPLDNIASATITGDNIVCKGADGVVYTTESGMENYSWYISSGGNITSGETTDKITVIWKLAGNQRVAVEYKDPIVSGPMISGFYEITVDPLPEDAGTMTGPERVCQGDQEVIYSVPPISAASDYVWMLPTGATIISGANTNTIKVAFSLTAIPGNVAVYGTNHCGDGTVSRFYPVNVHPIPATPLITTTGNILHSNAPNGNLWYFNGNIIPGATKQEYEATQNGQYWSVVTLEGCSSDPSNIVDFVLTGSRELEESAFQMYPVPNNGQFYIKCKDLDRSSLKIQVYNSLGLIVYDNNDVQLDASSTAFVDLQTISRGTYAVVIQDGTHQVMKKMLITK
jgi:hypothetical protein